jgi:hypothetical protein
MECAFGDDELGLFDGCRCYLERPMQQCRRQRDTARTPDEEDRRYLAGGQPS